MKGKTSIIAIGALALITFALVAGVLVAAQKKTPVVVAARALEAGTRLSLADVEIVQVHAGAVHEGAFETVEEVVGLVTSVQRMPGDQITADMIGDEALNALAQALAPGHRAVAIHVDQASGLAGLLRPGDTVSAIGIIDPTAMGGTGAQASGAGAKVMLTGLKVLFVPYEFRYREISEDDAGGMSPVMSSSSGRDKGVILLSVPVQPITITWQLTEPVPVTVATASPITASEKTTDTTGTMWGRGDTPAVEPDDAQPADPNPSIRVSPVELLALLDARASVYLAMEPVSERGEIETPGVYLLDLLPTFGEPEADAETVFIGGQR